MKTWMDISLVLRNDKDESVNIHTDQLHHYLQYFVFSTDQKMPGIEFFSEKEQLKTQYKLQWMKSFRDVYKKFIHTKQAESFLSSTGVCLPFFYVRNNNFSGIFMRDSEYRPVCILNPSKTMAAYINDQGIQKVIQNICHDEQEEEEEKKKKEDDKRDNEQDDEEMLDEDITKLLADQPEDRRTFNIIKREQTQLFIFKDKEVNQIYNLLLNFVSNLIDTQMSSNVNQACQIIAPAPFLSCTYNECQTFYSGKVVLANK